MASFKGSCLCGEIRYELDGDILGFYHCHCQRCRKQSGTGHASNLRIDAKEIHWLSGEDLLKTHRVPDAFRFRNDFCGECGSPMPRYFEETGFVLLPAGTLDCDVPVQPQARIFTGSKAGWSCEDELPAFEEYPG